MRRITLVGVLVFVIMTFSMMMRVSSHGDIKLLRHQLNDKTYYYEIITSNEIKQIVVEALNDKEEMIHYLILEDPATKKDIDGSRRNYFYITSSMANLENIFNLRVYPPNNRSINYNKIDVNTITVEVVEVLGGSMKDIKIMSYNIHHGKSLLGADTLNTIVAIIEESGADIIGIQELDNGIPRSKFRNQLKYLAEKLSMQYAYGENLNVLGGKYGNGLLSKFPIVMEENILLPSRREQRGLLRADIDIEGIRIHFLVTHLGLNMEERNRQVNVINRYMDTLIHPTILLGDFNAHSNSKEIRSISKRMLDAGAFTGNEDIPTFDLPFLSGRIDYIFLSPSLKINKYNVIKNRTSDHYPVEVYLTLP